MHCDTTGSGKQEPSRTKVLGARGRRTLRLMGRRFMLGLAYCSGSACVSLVVLGIQHRWR
ncbi:hypothetical protein ACN6K9_005981 [Streptomyces sp. SAS_267]|uniref:hypothetical protein n=1 Tax=unclassified Streptomyces TaxID=2593676 RepID=UPI0036FF6DD3